MNKPYIVSVCSTNHTLRAPFNDKDQAIEYARDNVGQWNNYNPRQEWEPYTHAFIAKLNGGIIAEVDKDGNVKELADYLFIYTSNKGTEQKNTTNLSKDTAIDIANTFLGTPVDYYETSQGPEVEHWVKVKVVEFYTGKDIYETALKSLA